MRGCAIHVVLIRYGKVVSKYSTDVEPLLLSDLVAFLQFPNPQDPKIVNP